MATNLDEHVDDRHRKTELLSGPNLRTTSGNVTKAANAQVPNVTTHLRRLVLVDVGDAWACAQSKLRIAAARQGCGLHEHIPQTPQ